MPLRGHLSELNSKYQKMLISTNYASGGHGWGACSQAGHSLPGFLCDGSGTDDA